MTAVVESPVVADAVTSAPRPQIGATLPPRLSREQIQDLVLGAVDFYGDADIAQLSKAVPIPPWVLQDFCDLLVLGKVLAAEMDPEIEGIRYRRAPRLDPSGIDTGFRLDSLQPGS